MSRQGIEDVTVEESTGNVFEDLGLPDAEERLAKALLSRRIERAMRERGITQAAAARLWGASQPDVSKVARGNVSGYSLERLARLLTVLGQDVEIVVRPTEDAAGGGHLVVSSG